MQLEVPNHIGPPPGEIRATIIVIHQTAPEKCPDCGTTMEPCDVAENAPDGLYALRCVGNKARHRVHVQLDR